MKIRFVVIKDNDKKMYYLQTRKFFGWVPFCYTVFSYGGTYKQIYFSKSKKELLEKLKSYYNKNTIDIQEYQTIKRYTI